MTQTKTSSRQINAAIVAGCLVAFFGFGFAATFGVFLRPMSADLGWAREIFSLSVAVQALFWGFTQPFAGAYADRFGSARVLGFGAIMSALGFFLRGIIDTPQLFILTGIIVGIGTGACSFPVVIIALGKIVSEQKRSFILGLGTAAASFGMFAAAPATIALIEWLGWRTSMFVVASSFLLILPTLFTIAQVAKPTAAAKGASDFSMAIKIAFTDRSYLCLFFGFFVCGFHVSFIQTHLPAYVVDLGLAASVGGWSLALIGLFNIIGSFGSGWAGKTWSKKNSLSGIYFARAVTIAIFILTPISPTSVYVFSGVMGLLWLSTVPLTMGLVAQTQGLTFLSTLAGLVFLGHQTGAFLGAWLGGRIYDVTQGYTAVWWAAVGFGLLATLLHLPIREQAGTLAKMDPP